MSCFLSPVCVIAGDEASIGVFSISIGLALAGSTSSGNDAQPAREVALLLVNRNTLVCQARCRTAGQLRFTVPPGVLQPSVVTAYVALCNEQGSVAQVLDSGRLLVVDHDAAAEVQALFSQTTARVQQLLSIRPPPTSSGSAVVDNRQPQRTWGLLSPLMAKLGSPTNRKPGPKARGSAEQPPASVAAAAAAEPARQESPPPASPPDAAALYAYEHLIVPFLQLWVGVFASPEDAAGSCCSAGAPVFASGAHRQQVLQLLSLLVELELWACSLVVLGKFPNLAADMQGLGFSALEEECGGASVVSKLRKLLQPHGPADASRLLALYGQQQPQQSPHLWAFQQQLLLQQSQLQQQEAGQRQQQHLQQQQALQSILQAQQQAQQQPPMHERRLLHQPVDSVLMQYKQMLLLQQQQQQHAGMQGNALALPARMGSKSPSGSDESVESASEILVRLGLLQQARGEQEALAECMGTACHSEGDALSLCCLNASSAWSEPLPVAQPAAYAAATARTTPASVQPPARAALRPFAVAAAARAAAAGLPGRPTHQPGPSALAAAAERPGDPAMLPTPVQLVPAIVGPVAAGSSGRDAPAAAAAAAAAGSGFHTASQASVPPQGSLFGRHRRLSWEEEQPDPVPQPPALPGSAAQPRVMEVGWYPGSWQLPEPSHNQLLGRAGLAGAVDFGPSVALPPAPLPGYATPSCAGQELDDARDPYTEPSYAAGLMCNRQLQQEPQQEQQLPNALQQEQRLLLQQQQQLLEHLLQQQQQLQLQLQQQLQQCGPVSSIPEAEVPLAADGMECGSDAGDSASSCTLTEFVDCCEGSGSSLQDSCCQGSSSSMKQDACCQGSSSCMKDDACCSAGRSTDIGLMSRALLPPAVGMAWPQLLRLCAWGFQDPCLEASYLVFKNHGCRLLDATAGILCTAMLVTSAMRSFRLQADSCVWAQLMTMLIYAAFFFLPYVAMQLRVQTFLRLRELLLVVGRSVSGMILAVMARGYLPMVAIWRIVVVNTLSLQIQNGFILPACQQVRLPAALVIAAVHVPADAIWLAAGRPFKVALVHSIIMQVVALAVTFASDAWCRRRFLQRYSGVLRQRPTPALLQ